MIGKLFSLRVVRILTGAVALGLLVCFGIMIYIHTHTVQVPVLMYHHIDPVAGNDMIVTPERFEEQIAALTQAGYESVSIQQLIDYVDNGAALPEQPVLITFDDGYTSNLALAAPVLERYGQHAVIFAIGINAGQEYYIHTGELLSPPRFALKEALPYIQSGTLEIQSHTYDLHQLADYGISGRDGVLPIPGEFTKTYLHVLEQDAQKQQELFSEELGSRITALAYPFGLCCDDAEKVMTEQGIRVTFTTFPGTNPVRQYIPSSLRELYRHTVTEQITGEELVALLHTS